MSTRSKNRSLSFKHISLIFIIGIVIFTALFISNKILTNKSFDTSSRAYVRRVLRRLAPKTPSTICSGYTYDTSFGNINASPADNLGLARAITIKDGNKYVVDAYDDPAFAPINTSGNRLLKYGPSNSLLGWASACTSGSNCNTSTGSTFGGRSNGFTCTSSTCTGINTGGGDFQFDIGMSQENRPKKGGMVVDSLGNFYLAESTNNRIVKFSPTMTNPRWIGRCDGGANCTNVHTGINNDGKPLGFNCDESTCTRTLGNSGPYWGQFLSPTDLAILPINGNEYLYVLDTLNYRVQVFNLTTNGAYVGEFSTKHYTTTPGVQYDYGLAARVWNGKNQIFISNKIYSTQNGGTWRGANYRINRYDNANGDGFTFTRYGAATLGVPVASQTSDSAYGTQGIAADSAGNILVAFRSATESAQVAIINYQNDLPAPYLSNTPRIGQGILIDPIGVTIDPSDSSVYVVDNISSGSSVVRHFVCDNSPTPTPTPTATPTPTSTPTATPTPTSTPTPTPTPTPSPVNDCTNQPTGTSCVWCPPPCTPDSKTGKCVQIMAPCTWVGKACFNNACVDSSTIPSPTPSLAPVYNKGGKTPITPIDPVLEIYR